MAIFTTWITCPSLALLFRGKGHELKEDTPPPGLTASIDSEGATGLSNPKHAVEPDSLGPAHTAAASASSCILTMRSHGRSAEFGHTKADHRAAGDAAVGGGAAAAGDGVGGGCERASFGGGASEPISPRVRRSTGSITLLYSRDSSSRGRAPL